MILDMVRVLVDAGATPGSAVRAATVLGQGGTISEAWNEVEIAPEPARFDALLLSAEITRAREIVLAGSDA
jgi:hypothetical protein